jgi:hypothetical protein
VQQDGIGLAAEQTEELVVELHATLLGLARSPKEAVSLIFSVIERLEPDRAGERVRRVLRCAAGQ